MRGNNRDPGVKLQCEDVELEAWRRNLERHDGGLVVDGLDTLHVLRELSVVGERRMLHLPFEREDDVFRRERHAVAPGRVRIQGDRQFREVRLGVLHPIGEPWYVPVSEDGIVGESFPQQIVPLLVRVSWQGPRIGDADRCPATPAEDQRLVAWDRVDWAGGTSLGPRWYG